MKITNHKKIFCIFIFIIIIIIGITTYINFNTSNKNANTTNKKEKNIIYNTQEGIVEDKNVDNILFTDISCIIENGKTKIKYIITNNKDESVILNDYQLVFKDKHNEVIGIVYGNLPTELTAKSNINIDNYTTLNLKDAVTLEFELSE